MESIRAPHPGGDLITSIDLRIQYLAYRELKAAVQEHRAKAGTVIVLDIETGEVLAMVNQPAYNPNDRDQVAASRYRNRAATDIFEPGSSIKPFIAAAGIASGRYHANTIIDTSPGFVRVGIKNIPDKHNLGADFADHGAGEVEQRRHDQDGDDAVAQVDAATRCRRSASAK